MKFTVPCMNTSMDQWIRTPQSAQKDGLDLLSKKMKKISIDSSRQKSILPSMLTSSSNEMWLSSSSSGSSNNLDWIKAQSESISKFDNSKWLLKSSNDCKVETDLVTLTEVSNPWLATSTTSLSALPGSSSSVASIMETSGAIDQNSLRMWLRQPDNLNISSGANNDLSDWLWVPTPQKSSSNSSFERLLNANEKVNVEEWLRKALDDETGTIDDDFFDDVSIEVIDQ